LSKDFFAVEAAPRLANVRWLGGSPCAGKSTIAAILAEQHGLRLYSCDAEFARHIETADSYHQPTLSRLRGLSAAEVFDRPLKPMVRDAVLACVEQFAMIAADLAAMPSGPPVLAEGMPLLPASVMALRSRPAYAAWLVPAPDFQRAHYGRREWAASLMAGMSDPDRVFEKWMRRDEICARWVRGQASKLHLPVYVIENDETLDAVTAWAERQLGLAPGEEGSLS
jgi:hypothetical protein